jgi:hypothetical protein
LVRKRPFFINNTVIARVIPRLVSLCVLSGVDILNLLMRARFIISFEKKLRPHATNQHHANRTTPTQVSSHRLSITVLHHSLPYRDDPYRLQDNTSRPYHTIPYHEVRRALEAEHCAGIRSRSVLAIRQGRSDHYRTQFDQAQSVRTVYVHIYCLVLYCLVLMVMNARYRVGFSVVLAFILDHAFGSGVNESA